MKRRKAALLALSPPQAGHGSHTDVWQGKASQYGGEMAGQTAFNGCEDRFLEKQQAPARYRTSSRTKGMDMHRGPPRPRLSSLQGMVWTVMPLSSRMRLVT